jgi:hypothetical protein
MMTTVNWQNPYQNRAGSWLRGNLHSHCRPASHCAAMSLDTLLCGYADADYDFLSVSDHLATTEGRYPGLVLIPGLEWNSRNGLMADHTQTRHDHIGIYGGSYEMVARGLARRSLESLLAESNTGLLRVANHPDWLFDEHFSFERLQRFANRLDGIEIYNASLEADPGIADSTWKWDRLLSVGKPLLGFACDDSHTINDIGLAWLMVRSEEKTLTAIFQALQSGNFYCSTGVRITELGRSDSRVWLELAEEARISVIGDQGRLLARSIGTSISWDFSSAETAYVRFLVENRNWQQAWSQPFFRDLSLLHFS